MKDEFYSLKTNVLDFLYTMPEGVVFGTATMSVCEGRGGGGGGRGVLSDIIPSLEAAD